MIANGLYGSNTQCQHKRINEKVLITDKKIKHIEKPEQLQQNKLKNEQTTATLTTTIKSIISIDKNKYNKKQINR